MAIAEGLSTGSLGLKLPAVAAWLIYFFFFWAMVILLRKVIAFKMKEYDLPKKFRLETLRYMSLSFTMLIIFIVVMFQFP